MSEQDEIITCNSDYDEPEFPSCTSEDGHSWHFTHVDEDMQAQHVCRICGLKTEGI